VSDAPEHPAGLPRVDDVDGLTVADVMHADVTSMPATATLGELRAWFAAGASRRLAVIADDGRYAGALTRADAATDAADDVPALEAASGRLTIAPSAPAAAGRDLALASETRRIPVVGEDGHFHGVLAVTSDLRHFACRPPSAPR
jgi:CBS domain-containing protein